MISVLILGILAVGSAASLATAYRPIKVDPVAGLEGRRDRIPPTWSRVLAASDRFQSVLGGEAVLDRETGLVWERDPDTVQVGWADASYYCYQRTIGARNGWRLPAVEEIMSLVDPSASQAPVLPAGHPFDGLLPEVYWSSTTIAGFAASGWGVSLNDGTLFDQTKSSPAHVWCVRGGIGHDGM
jgi:hypothetical protein